jgi:hypothetical protein
VQTHATDASVAISTDAAQCVRCSRSRHVFDCLKIIAFAPTVSDASIATDRHRLTTVRHGPKAMLSRWSVRRVRCVADGRVCRVEPRRAQLPQATDAGIVIPCASVAGAPPRLSRVSTRCNSGEPTNARVASVAPRASVCCPYFDGFAMFARSACYALSHMS